MAVPPRVSLVTLGVANVAASTRFYEALGWPLSSASVPGEVSFFQTDGGLLALYDVTALAADAGADAEEATGFRGASLAINLESPTEVDAAVEDMRAAGGRVVQQPQATDWGGYTSLVADLDGHLWEPAYNPGWPLGPDNRPQLP
jgi:uncharacterized protein